MVTDLKVKVGSGSTAEIKSRQIFSILLFFYFKTFDDVFLLLSYA